MSNILRIIFIDSFVRGVGKTTGALVTMFVGWQVMKVTYGHDDLLSFMLGKKKAERENIQETLSNDQDQDHEEINLEDMEEHKFKNLFDKLNR